MKTPSTSRRNFIKQAAVGTALVSLPDLINAQSSSVAQKKKILCVGAHPDDPESGCGGTLSLLAKAGHEVTVIYLTSGERGIKGEALEKAGAIRKQEAINACKIMNVKPVFAGQIDGDTFVNQEWTKKIQKLIESEAPDIVFSHWPIDSHEDHQVSSLLVNQAWLRSKKRFMLYYFEVCIGEQSMIFHPTDYVDITATQEQKRKAVYCHISQDPAGIYECGHTSMEEFRGREIAVKAAEAFIRLSARGQGGAIV